MAPTKSSKSLALRGVLVTARRRTARMYRRLTSINILAEDDTLQERDPRPNSLCQQKQINRKTAAVRRTTLVPMLVRNYSIIEIPLSATSLKARIRGWCGCLLRF